MSEESRKMLAEEKEEVKNELYEKVEGEIEYADPCIYVLKDGRKYPSYFGWFRKYGMFKGWIEICGKDSRVEEDKEVLTDTQHIEPLKDVEKVIPLVKKDEEADS